MTKWRVGDSDWRGGWLFAAWRRFLGMMRARFRSFGEAGRDVWPREHPLPRPGPSTRGIVSAVAGRGQRKPLEGSQSLRFRLRGFSVGSVDVADRSCVLAG